VSKPERPIPATAAALLADLNAAGGSIPYRDPRVTISGLTALRARGIARVVHVDGVPRVSLMALATPCTHPNAAPSKIVPAESCPDCGAVFQRRP
jgi:hypothetical protein